MIASLLSGDLPRSRILTAMLVAIFAALALAPFVFPGTRPLDVAAKVCVFVLLVASYDLLLGYTGIVSFAHTMFFGIGGYGIAIALSRLEVGWTLAYVVQEATYTIVAADGPVVLLGAETFVLGKTDKGWKIKHVHMSAKRVGAAKPAVPPDKKKKS